MWCCRRMEKISWPDHVRNEVLLRVNEERNILHEIRKRKAKWIGHMLWRKCLLKQVIEGEIKGEIEVTRRRGRRCKKLLDDLKERRGYSHLKEEALDRTMWRNRFGRGVGPVVRQITEWMNLSTRQNTSYTNKLLIFEDIRRPDSPFFKTAWIVTCLFFEMLIYFSHICTAVNHRL